MSSILTNTSAMVALQTLRGINASLAQTQNEISTGKSVSTAKDDSAIWAISKVMETDVESFMAISQSLALGESTVAVARNAAETITDVLTEIKAKIVAAQEENVDREKIQTDISNLIDQIESIAGSAQFNGLNLLQSGDDVAILASLDRSGATTTARSITVARQDLSLQTTGTAATFGATAVTNNTIANNSTATGGGGTNTVAGTGATVADAGSQFLQAVSVGDGYSYRITINDTGGTNALGSRSFEYVASASDTTESVMANLNTQIANFLAVTGTSEYTVSRTGDEITLTNNSGGNATVTFATATGGTAGTSAGGLGNLATIDVTTNAGATAALTTIETMIDTAIDAAAEFGSAQGRIELQSNFVSELTDSLKSGIGILVDADMEVASARLQALQVQQQLGIQSLSIANQAPQSILALFR